MKVNLAAQILSHSVAAGINTLANLGFFPPDACVTPEFVETFDQLFNCFNSGSNKSTQKYRNPFSDNSGHKAFLETCLKFLAKIKTESGNNLPCINGWQISIKALFNLWEDLQTCGFKYLLTNRANQDSLECLFSIIRGRGGSRDNPDPQQFRAAFRHVVIKKLFVQSQLSNCEFDTNKILLDIASIAIYQKKQKPTVSVENPEVTDIFRIANPHCPYQYKMWQYISQDIFQGSFLWTIVNNASRNSKLAICQKALPIQNLNSLEIKITRLLNVL